MLATHLFLDSQNGYPSMKFYAHILLVCLAGLSSCQQTPSADPTTRVAIPTADLPAPTVSPTKTPTPIPPTATPEPADTLFPIAWADKSPFTAGLISSEQATLDQFDKATIYHMKIAIAPQLDQLSGQQAVRYTNKTGQPLSELYLRLYPNLTDGSAVISNLKQDGQPLTPAYSMNDSTLVLSLESPLAADESTTLSLDFTVQIPQLEGGNYGTFIYDQEILALAHFYPFIPVFDDEGWNVEIPSPMGDIIYGESSFYLVEVTAPAAITLAGSGVIIAESTQTDQQIKLFAAGPMRDFYLIASKRFEKISTLVGETTINHYGFPSTAEENELALQYAAEAVRIFNEQIGPYPFTELDLAASPTRALGVEYPGIVINNASLYTQPNNRLETTTVHEVGHQWFYSTVGNDQLDEPWLDESFTQFATLLYFEQLYPSETAQDFLGSLEAWAAYATENNLPLGQPVREYERPEFAYGAAIYGRGPLFFVALREQIGAEAFADFLSNYYNNFKFGIATTETLKTTAEQSCTCSLDELFETWIYAE